MTRRIVTQGEEDDRQTHLPLALFCENLTLGYIHPVPGYGQLQLPLPAL